jgi:nicotinamide riboside kinase
VLVVVEGISASGKTTWCRKHATGFTVSETGPRDDAPDAILNPAAAARFWVEQGERRWQDACAIERVRGVAVCDTDPIKLHYIWSLWQIGVAAERVWQAEHAATRDAIADGRIGFADAYLVKPIDPKHARQQRDADPSRSRRNFELHVKLLEPLMTWYRGLEAVLPGAVTWGLPEDGLARLSDQGNQRAGEAVQIFDQMINILLTYRPISL